MTTNDNIDFDITTADKDMVFVHAFDDKVWLALHLHHASARVILTKDEARQVAEAMQKLIAVAEVA